MLCEWKMTSQSYVNDSRKMCFYLADLKSLLLSVGTPETEREAVDGQTAQRISPC